MTQTLIHLLESDYFKKCVLLKVLSCSSLVRISEVVMAFITLHLRSLLLFLCMLSYKQPGPVSLSYFHSQSYYQKQLEESLVKK